ncbi:MFS transporter [Nocardioides sp. TF02-7]|nr:MFS transporter [Nocardioides sp. TF02-7]
MPQIAETHGVPISTAQWALTVTLIAGAVATPVLGRWGSGRLRRPVVLGGLATVFVGSVLSALPIGLGPLVAGRALQGVGLALFPLAIAVARDLWTGPVLVSRLALLSVTTVAGAGLGYPVTAVVASGFGVAGAYWFGALLIGLTFALAFRHLPRSTTGERPQRVDLAGAALLSAGTVALLLAISQGDRAGWTSWPILGSAAAGVALLVAWVAWTAGPARRRGHPLVDLRLAARRGVVGPNAVTFGIGLGMYGLLALVVILVQGDPHSDIGLGHDVAVVGLVLVPYALLSVSGNRLARVVAARWGPHLLLPTGCAVFASAMLLLAFVHHHLWQALLVMALGGLGSGFTFSSLPMLIVPHVPRAETGSALAFNQLLRYLGFSVGSAASVTLLDAYGGDDAAFRATALTLASVCLAAGCGVLRRKRS